MNKDLKKTEENEKVEQGRRDLIKKAAYIAPTLVVLGALSPIAGNAAQSLDECPPGNPAGNPGC